MTHTTARSERGWRISFGKRRASAARRVAKTDTREMLLNGYIPLNPDTFGKPRSEPLPFTPDKDKSDDDE